MFVSQATQSFLGSTWKGGFMHVAVVPRGYHTTAYPTIMVILAIFLCSYGSIMILQLNYF